MSIDRLDGLLADTLPLAPPPAGALDDLAVLEGTQVLDVLVDAARSRAGVLLESRASAAVPGGNAVVLVVTGLREVGWARQGEAERVHAFSVVGGFVTEDPRGHRLVLQCEPHADLTVVGSSVSAHVVLVPGLPTAPVDYAEDDATIRAGTPSWEHGAEVLASWVLGAAP